MLTVFPSLLGVDFPLENIIVKQALQLVLLLLFPVVFGMFLRSMKPQLMIIFMPTLEKIGAVGLLLLLLAIFFKFHQKIVEQLSSLLLLALIFTFASLLIAYCLSLILKLNKKNEAAVVIEFPVRNLALAALIAVSIFKNTDYLLFAAVFFVIQTPIMLCIITGYRSVLGKQDVVCKQPNSG
jgi:BASS family bile acid:Na+ symporter